MKAETLLPLGKLDPGLRAPEGSLDYSSVKGDARLVDRLGYYALLMEETKDDPFQVLSLAANCSERVRIGTSVAIAFARSPFTLAQSAWTAHKISGGRFELGIGSQVKGHIRRRHGLEWHPPVPWMKDYVGALRAIWESWEDQTLLEYESEHYNLNLNVPLFTPSSLEMHPIPIHIAAVNSGIFKLAVEIAEGVRLHPVCGAKYISNILLPLTSEDQPNNFEICLKPLVASARDEKTLSERKEIVRERLAFYLSTPAYSKAFEVYAIEDLCAHMNLLSRETRWDDMAKMVTDELLEEIAIVGLYGELAKKIEKRYGAFLDRIELSIPINSLEDEEELGQIISDLGGVR